MLGRIALSFFSVVYRAVSYEDFFLIEINFPCSPIVWGNLSSGASFLKDLMTLKSSAGFVQPACQKRYVYTFPACVKAIRLQSRMADTFRRFVPLRTKKMYL